MHREHGLELGLELILDLDLDFLELNGLMKASMTLAIDEFQIS